MHFDLRVSIVGDSNHFMLSKPNIIFTLYKKENMLAWACS